MAGEGMSLVTMLMVAGAVGALVALVALVVFLMVKSSRRDE